MVSMPGADDGILRFGVSAASTAVEAAPAAPDRLSIWDVFAAAPGRVTDGSSPAAGPAHRRRWQEDVRLLADLGVDCYRFSLPWSRLHDPAGTAGREVESEWRHYQALTDGLLATGIEPVVTLCHYDMPVALMAAGGWLSRDTARVFADFAATAVRRLGDRVGAWVTVNSPLVHAVYGYGVGIEAPGLTLLGGCLTAAVNQLVGHGLAVAAVRAGGGRSVGIANSHAPVSPADPADEADRRAAALVDALVNRAFTDPLFGRPWPSELDSIPGVPVDLLDDADRRTVAAPLDFYGVNYYHPHRVRAAPDNLRVPFDLVGPVAGEAVDEFGWPVAPAGLTAVLTTLTHRLPGLPPLWVTENGTQDAGGLADEHRVAFIADHVAAVRAARAAGVDVRRYLHWSLLDGWEFGEGLTRRFGLVAVDATTGRRTPKHSFAAYQRLLTAAERER
jgi:beta-glucosidase